jgi:hypothetical protein
MEDHRKSKKSTPKTTERQQSVIKARLKLQTQNFFSIKSIYKSISRLKVESGNSEVIMSLEITQQQRMLRLIAIPSSQRRFCYG